MTDGPYPANGGAQLFTGPGTNGPLIPAGTANGPVGTTTTTTTTPPAAPTPCKCVLLTARIVPGTVKLVDPGARSMRLEFGVHWVLNCSKGADTEQIGKVEIPACSGKLVMFAPSRKGKSLADTRTTGYLNHFVDSEGRTRGNVEVKCVGHCAKVTEGTAHFRLDGGNMGHALRAKVKSLPITIHRYCRGRAPLADIKLSIAFDGLGLLDLEDSDLR